MQKLLLASHSPRRKELIERLRVPFEVMGSDVEENINHNQSPEEVVQSLAFQKASSVASRYPECYTIGADTIVVYENQILGKPKDEQDAFQMLHTLSGKRHKVLTGVSIHHHEKHINFYEQTEVTFWELSKEEISSYIQSKEPFDKAGAYGIQGYGSLLVKEIKGDYFNVVGLPIASVYRQLKSIHFPF